MKPVTARLKQWKDDAMHAMYPNFCLFCDTETKQNTAGLCPVCQSEMHFTMFEDYDEPTSLDKLFWGRVQLSGAYALLHFEEQNSTQSVLHALKYSNRPDIAVHFGKELADKVSEMEIFSDLDALIPVPLHPKKQFIRGYNQSEMLAKGMANVLEKPVDVKLLKRIAFTESQTKKDKTSRWENMQNRFQARKSVRNYKHVAIVDDVITTGSTLEMCVKELNELLPDCKISVISLAVAR